MSEKQTPDLHRLADELDCSAATLDEALTMLWVPATDLNNDDIAALSSLWRLTGRLAGMADALRLMERANDR